jgi:hypothetical protein
MAQESVARRADVNKFKGPKSTGEDNLVEEVWKRIDRPKSHPNPSNARVNEYDNAQTLRERGV